MSTRKYKTKLDEESPGIVVGACGCFVFVWLFFAMIGGWLFQYSLYSITGKDAPWWADVIGGIVLSGFLVPLAVLCWILRLAGVDVPFWQ